jgi:hypothetical protein
MMSHYPAMLASLLFSIVFHKLMKKHSMHSMRVRFSCCQWNVLIYFDILMSMIV